MTKAHEQVPVRKARVLGPRFILVSVSLMAVGVALTLLWYAFTWSDRYLAPVHAGMSQAEVRELVGAPLHATRYDRGEIWDYKRSWSSDARIYFDLTGRVVTVETD